MFSSNDSATFKAFPLVVFLLLLSTLQACGLPIEQGGSDGSSSNLDSEDTDSRDPTLTLGKTLIINAERLNGSTDLSLSNVSLVSLSANFTEINDGGLPEWDVRRSESTNNIELVIDSDYVEQINHVVKVRFSDEEIYYAAIPYVPVQSSTTAQVTVNIYTHYLLKKLFDGIADSDEMDTHLPCLTNDPVIGCENQPRAKQDYLAMVNNAIAEFNFELSTSSSVSQALVTLEQQDEIRQYTEFSTNELTRETSPFAKGTMREVTALGFDADGNALSTPLPWPKTFNSVFFSLSAGDAVTTEGLDKVVFGAANSTIIENRELANELPAYPRYQSTTYLTDLRRESALFIDVPYDRTTSTVINNSFDVDRSEPINTYASATAPDSFLSREGHILDGRSLTTTQPGDVSDVKDVAWQYEPVFAKLYQVNEYEPEAVLNPSEETEIDFGNEPTWLASANYSKAANYRVNNPGDENESLGRQLEDLDIFSWELHSLQTPTTFTTGALSGKSYGVISLSQKLRSSANIESSEKVIEIYGETMLWEAASNVFTINQPTTDDHYRSYSISRSANNSLTTLTEQNGRQTGILDSTRSFFSEASEVADPSSETGVDSRNLGILKLDGGSEAPIGHATESGDYFAFSFNTSDTESAVDRGAGIIVGMALDNVSPIFPDLEDSIQATYNIQGNNFSILGNTNTLQNLNGSSLLITNRIEGEIETDCHATLQLSSISVSHTLIQNVSNTLSAPRQTAANDIVSTDCTVNDKAIEIQFADVFGQDLTLKGFISKTDGDLSTTPGNLLTLLWLQENTIGLIFAGKDQILDAGFD